MQQLIDKFPALYRTFLPEAFFGEVPTESLATCDDCIMCSDYEHKKKQKLPYFIPDTKCCTYQPHLPNYLVGGLLTTPLQEEGKNRMLVYISNRIGVTPLAIKPSTRFNAEYNAFKKLTFGKNKAFRCSFFETDTGNCTIYPYWNGVCSTWFCKSVGDVVGQTFWVSVRNVMQSIELLLARYACTQLGLSLSDLYYQKKILQPDGLDRQIDEKIYAQIWGKWCGNEEAFYQQAYQLIQELDKAKFEKIVDVNYQQDLLNMQQKKEAFIDKMK